jgi:hypothetical protein
MSYITNYYKGLFGAPEEDNLSLDESRTDDTPQVSKEENSLLTKSYTEDEVQKAVFQMKHNKAPGPDGFPTEFFQSFWEVFKFDPLALFCDLLTEQLELFRLNFREIILLPKINEAERIQQYRPICLLSVSFKISTKVASIRLDTLAHHMVRPSKTSF